MSNFKPGDVVGHITETYDPNKRYINTKMSVVSVRDNIASCRFFNDSKKSFTVQDFDVAEITPLRADGPKEISEFLTDIDEAIEIMPASGNGRRILMQMKEKWEVRKNAPTY